MSPEKLFRIHIPHICSQGHFKANKGGRNVFGIHTPNVFSKAESKTVRKAAFMSHNIQKAKQG